jgi:hypothetical protein
LSLVFARPLSTWTWLNGGRLKVIGVATAIALLAGKGVLAHWHSDRDSRSMAAEIAAVISPKEFDGITFLDMRPFYGLNLYLDRPVKAVPFTAGTGKLSAFAAGEDLCSEIARNRRTLFAMKEGKVEKFRAGLVTCGGATPAEVGHFNADGNKIALFVLRGGPPAT